MNTSEKKAWEMHLTRAKKNWDRSRERSWGARFEMNDTIRNAAENGMTQAEIGRVIGWPRQRVNTVLGKES